MERVGETQYHLGRTAEALVTFQRVLAAAERRDGAASPAAAVALATVGLVLLDTGDLIQAQSTLGAALARLDALNPAGTLDTGVVLFGLGRLAVRQGDDLRALTSLLRALPLYEAAHGPGAPETAALQETLGLAELRLRLTLPARQHLVAALDTVQRRYGPDAPATGRLAAALAVAYTDSPPGTQDYGQAMTYHRLFTRAFFASQQAAFRTLDSAGKVQFNAQAREQFTRYFEAVFIERMVDEAASRPLVREAFDSWLSFKGSASALENGLSALLSRADAPLRAQVQTYLDLRGELATLSTAPPLTVQDAARTAARLGDLHARIAALESALSGQLGRFQDTLLPGRVTLDDLQAVLRPARSTSTMSGPTRTCSRTP
ncbi:tetratricopeptide repeat protein [Deinococcus metalli]|uniref:tetratricopeptide repeat protein n=1 Tax=Deinococcus metalli TaxID=1141878 RepID=UPI0036226C67